MRPIDTVVIHCSATANGVPLTADGATPLETIDRWHRARKFQRAYDARVRFQPNLTSIGYHYVVYANGDLARGRALEEVGAHAAGHNARSIGLCMIGMDAYSLGQWATLRAVVEGLEGMFPGVRVVGHRDLSPDADGDGVVEKHEWLKTCPGFDVSTWRNGGMAPLADHLLEG